VSIDSGPVGLAAGLSAPDGQLGAIELTPIGDGAGAMWVSATSPEMLRRTVQALWQPSLTGRVDVVNAAGARTLVAGQTAAVGGQSGGILVKALVLLALAIAVGMIAISLLRRERPA